ncbi:hypothetical protein B0T16DRAFT_89790 [Cercophora newfieldiana]|uniref:Uncharacterized protein n=1 Tax=Cercophora newfieldiana TaxID=92897 RepID=A0AA39YFX2_9PEZI|nr:hypothetical protein B0T16DRAFT_89790 [Cercophora newfieldiana]
MYINSKPPAPRPLGGAEAERDSDPVTPSTSSLALGPSTHIASTSSSLPPPGSEAVPGPSSAEPVSQPKRNPFSLPFPFPPLFQPNASSTSLAPSTAEGKAIPLDNTTAAHRTSALQKLNSTYPSEVRRHRYTKSAGAQSSTYSQPVLVRTYSGPPPPQTSHGVRSPRYRPSSGSRGVARRVPLPVSSRQSAASLSGRPTQPALSGIGAASTSTGQPAVDNGSRASGLSMPRHKPKKSSGKLPLPLSLPLPLPWQWQSGRPDYDEAKLPPLEAFSFKSFMADMQARGGEDDIGADLDRIAEICARSRYSLSNQYEVHVAPHGSGTSFTGSTVSGHRRKGHNVGGPTLQAFNSDDDDGAATRSRGKRRSGGRRKSVAYGTLETIMSSSRSSEEDQTKKKPAAEIAEEVRGRAAKKKWDSSTGSGSKSGSTANVAENNSHQRDLNTPLARKKSASFASAIIDNSRSTGKNDAPSALVSEPALPQTSNTNLAVRTTPDAAPSDSGSQNSTPPSPIQQVELADELPHQEGLQEASGRASWSSWIPWRTQSKVGTEGPPKAQDTLSQRSLRQLLKSVETAPDKGKAIDQG